MTFYETVLAEVNASNSGGFRLCTLSDTFKAHWALVDKYDLIILAHANQFMRENPNKYMKIGGMTMLFVVDPNISSEVSHKDQKQVRIDFLEWAIKNNLDLEV